MRLNEYELFSVCRQMKGGCGVALYIINEIYCKLLSAKSFATDDILECVTVELSGSLVIFLTENNIPKSMNTDRHLKKSPVVFHRVQLSV